MDVEPATFVEDAASTEKVHSEGEDDGDQTPALFVTSMPRDVWANPSLGALAALIDEANEQQDGDEVHQGTIMIIIYIMYLEHPRGDLRTYRAGESHCHASE